MSAKQNIKNIKRSLNKNQVYKDGERHAAYDLTLDIIIQNSTIVNRIRGKKNKVIKREKFLRKKYICNP